MQGLITKLLFCSTTLFSILTISIALDTISPNQTIRDGETIVSADGGNFELGLFRPSNFSENRYLGIWYKKISAGNNAVVWVANREDPLTDASGIIRLTGKGVLQLINSSNRIIWSSNSSRSTTGPVAQLLDSGNLVIRDETASASPENFIWQSFDDPGDTILPGVKFGKDLVTGTERYMSSWKSVDDPSPGEYTVYFDLNGYPQVFQRKGSDIQYRLGGWNGLRFTGMPSIKPNPIYTFEFVFNQEEIYYKWELVSSTVISKVRLTPDGSMMRLTWIERTQDWFMYSTPTTDACARYALCGPNGSCNNNKFPPCGCLEGFEPKFQEQWNRAEWTSGCRRRVALDCASDEGFRRYFNVKQPDTRQSWFNQSMSLAECETMCKNKCSCTAYSNLNVTGRGSGCLQWFGDLIDIREYSENGQDIYIRMAASELGLSPKTKKGEIIKVVFSTLAGLILLGTTLTVYAWTRKKKGSLLKRDEGRELHTGESAKKDVELQSFSLSTIVNATNNFSHKNKLGEGGFGPVYKGLLEEGQEVAVKRLSKTSKQGLDEFKNEVICIAKLQHRNLVKLLGCCTHGEEMMLVYEYMPNKSLDCFIFDESQSSILDWPKRFNIINGIARGLMYLHQDSRLRIVHRDLKAGNILLDSDMNPRISDFGLARRFGGLETEANTNKVVGTYGYISPEYAVNGLFSVKSDVFSFGVLILETVSGKKNRGFSHGDHHDNLLGHAWRLYREGKSLELIDESLGNSCTEPEVVRSIHVGLLCVQQCAEDRPSMSTVVMMLGSEGVLPVPKQPGFFIERSIPEINGIQSILLPAVSINEITMTTIGR